MGRIAVAGAGAIGASIAYHLALRGARGVVLADPGGVAAGASGKAFGGIRQQFSTAAEVALARESVGFFRDLGPVLFQQVGYLFLATSAEGLAVLEERRALQLGLGVPVELLGPGAVAALLPGLATADVLGAAYCAEDGTSDPPAVTRELVRRAVELGVELRQGARVEELEADVRVIACGAWSAEVAAVFGAELPVRPLVRQLVATTAVAGLPERVPVTIEAETGFHFRRRDDRLVLAMAGAPHWGFEEAVDEALAADMLRRLAPRFPPAAGARIFRAWAGLYDMTPDAHPIIGWAGEGVYAACGFSGHGFMQSPAVGRAVAEELLDGASSLDLSPFRLERFAGGATFPESVIL